MPKEVSKEMERRVRNTKVTKAHEAKGSPVAKQTSVPFAAFRSFRDPNRLRVSEIAGWQAGEVFSVVRQHRLPLVCPR